jgi:hypothetical protein
MKINVKLLKEIKRINYNERDRNETKNKLFQRFNSINNIF